MLAKKIRDPLNSQKVMFCEDYRHLDRLMEKSKEKSDKKDLQRIIILFMVLHLAHISHSNKDKWKSYFDFIMKTFSEMPVGSDNWMCTLKLDLENNVVTESTFIHSSNIREDIEKVHRKIGIMDARKKYELDETEDHFYALYDIFDKNYGNFESKSFKFTDMGTLIKKAFRISCEDHLPLFLHLLITIAHVDMNMILNEVCQTKPLHHAARHDNISAVAYLMDRGASSLVEDCNGILPVYYAFMCGHSRLGDYLLDRMKNVEKVSACEVTHEDSNQNYSQKAYTSSAMSQNSKSEQINNIEKKALEFWNAHKKYLEYYSLNHKDISQTRQLQIQNYEQLLSDRLNAVRKIWEQEGIRATVTKYKVEYKDEAEKVKTVVGNFLNDLKLRIASENIFFAGDLEFVGSSEDNVRQYCPDEYDCNLYLNNISAYPDGGLKCDLLEYTPDEAKLHDHNMYLKLYSLVEHLRENIKGSVFLERFYDTVEASLKKLDLSNHQLQLILPGIKRTQVGVALCLLWQGEKYPMLLVDVDLVPTIKMPWPNNLRKPKCAIHERDFNEVYVNSLGNGEFRFSFGKAETALMKTLPEEKREVYLACKFILSTFKTENWVPNQLKAAYKYWDSQIFSLSSKGGFALKNSFFRELEEVTDSHEWHARNLLNRMCSIFKRMCEEIVDPSTLVVQRENESHLSSHRDEKENLPSVAAKRVRAYFGGDAEKSSIYLIAPEILNFLRSLDPTIISL
ncbi:hypothetical protein SK128_009452 [Halocaridina rubra]|uniref:Uncharacterized protein n=1 Tax=Halocaridina rubra TaxID=373956 RepID=A0AAN8WYH7_HALRR